MDLEENKALVISHYEELVNKKNVAVADDQLTADFVDHGAPPDRQVRGPEAARQAMKTLHSAIPDVHVTIDDIVAEGDRVAVRATWTGTHMGSFAGIPPSKKSLTIKGMVFWRLENGRIAERWHTMDLSDLMSP